MKKILISIAAIIGLGLAVWADDPQPLPSGTFPSYPKQVWNFDNGLLNVQIDNNGLGYIAGVPYVWPTENAVGVLANDGSGNLSWAEVSGGSGQSGGWTNWPGADAAGILANDGSGNLSWAPSASTTNLLLSNPASRQAPSSSFEVANTADASSFTLLHTEPEKLTAQIAGYGSAYFTAFTIEAFDTNQCTLLADGDQASLLMRKGLAGESASWQLIANDTDIPLRYCDVGSHVVFQVARTGIATAPGFVVSGTTNQIAFGATNSAPTNATNEVTVSVSVAGDTNAYFLKLYKQ